MKEQEKYTKKKDFSEFLGKSTIKINLMRIKAAMDQVKIENQSEYYKKYYTEVLSLLKDCEN